ncbi:hypothetical protein [Bacillus manliponensis]|nr:hypothetical protein [Bacillus manliponensis]
MKKSNFKKNLLIMGSLFTFSFFPTTMNVFADTIETDNIKIQTEDNTMKQESENSIDPVVLQDGPNDGTNDPASVQLEIRKISDNPYILHSLAPGKWNWIGDHSFKSQSKTFYSGGGDLMIYVSQPNIGPGFQWKYRLEEEDPAFNDTVKAFDLTKGAGTYELIFKVGSFVDGDNGKAELVLKKLTNPAYSVDTSWYD